MAMEHLQEWCLFVQRIDPSAKATLLLAVIEPTLPLNACRQVHLGQAHRATSVTLIVWVINASWNILLN